MWSVRNQKYIFRPEGENIIFYFLIFALSAVSSQILRETGNTVILAIQPRSVSTLNDPSVFIGPSKYFSGFPDTCLCQVGAKTFIYFSPYMHILPSTTAISLHPVGLYPHTAMPKGQSVFKRPFSDD